MTSGKLPDHGEIRGLPGATDVEAAVADEADRDALALELTGERGAHGDADARADDAVAAEIAAVEIADVHRAAAPAHRARRAAVQLGHHCGGCEALRERRVVRAMRARDRVARLQRAHRADGHGLLPGRRVDAAGNAAARAERARRAPRSGGSASSSRAIRRARPWAVRRGRRGCLRRPPPVLQSRERSQDRGVRQRRRSGRAASPRRFRRARGDQR